VIELAMRRKAFLDLALRRARPGSGSQIDTLLARRWTEPPVELKGLRTPFAIVGAMATRLYMAWRYTEDIDVLIHAKDADRLANELTDMGCERAGSIWFGGSSWNLPGGERLDVLESDEPWTVRAIQESVLSPDGLPVVRLPYLVLLKLVASRGHDLGDLARMLGGADEAALDEVRDAVRMYRPDDLNDLESLITLGKLEYQ
jgi:hypothetical protein